MTYKLVVTYMLVLLFSFPLVSAGYIWNFQNDPDAYNYSGSWQSPESLVDGDDGTATRSTTTGDSFYFNYSKISNVNEPAKHRLLLQDGEVNGTVPATCFNETPIQMRLVVTFSGRYNLECYNGTSWIYVYTDQQSSLSIFFEEGIYWNQSNDPPSINSLTVNTSGGSPHIYVENLTLTQDITDTYNETFYNTTDWRLNGTSIALVNMHFNREVTGTASNAVMDFTTYEHNGTLGGGISGYRPEWRDSSECFIGGCYNFNGADEYIDLDNESTIKPDLPVTMMAWVKVDSLASANPVFSNDFVDDEYHGVWMNIGTSGQVSAAFGDGQYPGSLSRRSVSSTNNYLTAGQWTHIAAVIRGATDMDIYVNGTKTSKTYSGSGGAMSYSSTGTARIGTMDGGSVTNYFDGQIDELLFFDRALSDEQIATIYSDQKNKKSVQTIASSETNIEDEWSACVYSIDSAALTDIDCSSNITIVDYLSNGESCSQSSDCSSNNCIDSYYEGGETRSICCATNACVSGSNICVSDLGTSGESKCYDGTWIANSGRFEVKNVSGNKHLVIDKYGSMVVSGMLTESCGSSAPSNSWKVEFNSDTQAYVDSSGNMCVDGTIQTRSIYSLPWDYCYSGNCLLIKDKEGKKIGAVRDDGKILLLGDYSASVGTIS